MEVWLIRHGKAEERGHGQSDEERRLVPRGQFQAERLASHIARLAEGKKVQFWCSPLVRGRETTEILMAPFGGIPHIQVEISEGDLTPLLNLWEKSGADVQIVVGHEPFLSEWLEEMTGRYQEFSTGSMARVRMVHLIPPEAEFISYVKSEDVG